MSLVLACKHDDFHLNVRNSLAIWPRKARLWVLHLIDFEPHLSLLPFVYNIVINLFLLFIIFFDVVQRCWAIIEDNCTNLNEFLRKQVAIYEFEWLSHSCISFTERVLVFFFLIFVVIFLFYFDTKCIHSPSFGQVLYINVPSDLGSYIILYLIEAPNDFCLPIAPKL